MNKITLLALGLVLMLAAGIPALTVDVDPVSGVDNGSSPFLTIEAALTAVTGADAGADTINLLTNGVHTLASGSALSLTVLAADGDLTIQGSGGQATVIMSQTGNPHATVSVAGGVTLNFANIDFIPPSTVVGLIAGDGFQITNGTSSGTATVNFTDVTLAANDGSDAALGYELDRNSEANASWFGDDWLDYFPGTAGTLTNVVVAHIGDEGILVRGDGGGAQAGADVTVIGNSVIANNGGRAVQLPFGPVASGLGDLTFTAMGTSAERIRLYNNNVDGAAEPDITAFNGDVTLSWVDVVNNSGYGIRVDTDTCDGFTADHLRVANSDGFGITFLFTTDHLPAATITDSTFHNQAPGQNNLEYTLGTTCTVTLTDCIFSGTATVSASGEDAIVLQEVPSDVNLLNCALPTVFPYGVTTWFTAQPPSSEVNTVSSSPRYVNTLYDVTDPQNPDFLRVQYTSTDMDYLTASSTAGELRGGNGLPLIEFIQTGVENFELYR